jgi:hypothetical protein
MQARGLTPLFSSQTPRTRRKVAGVANLPLWTWKRGSADADDLWWAVRVPRRCGAAAMRPQHNAADAAVVADLANEQQTGLPVGVGAWPQLHEISNFDQFPGFIACLAGGSPCPLEQGFKGGEFFFGEHSGESIDRPG